MSVRLLKLMIFLLIAAAVPCAAKAVQTPAIRVGHAATPISVDGLLDESAWQHAGVIGDLTQADPQPGKPTPFHTVVRVLRDADHLYFGITCHDPHPDRIAVHTLERDGNQGNDDAVTLVFDTFGGRRLGYWFRFNAGGARTDGLISPGGDTDTNWNGIWRVAVKRTPDGWTAEVAIATRSLQFGSTRTQWGFNVQRYVPRNQLILRWSGISLNGSVFDLYRAGRLTGVTGLAQGSGIDIKPYALGRYNSEPTGRRNNNLGVTIRDNFTPQLEGLLTVNPDFAQAEAEHGQINLGRFPLFFPEKRDFFLEGSNQFTFSHNLRIGDDGNLSTGFIPYFSRRIGLVNGRIVPINEGAKLVGHAGRFSIGALDVQTRNSAAAPANNLAVGRIAFNATDHLRVGTLFTHGDPAGRTSNTFAGVDGYWHTSALGGDKNLGVSAWAGQTTGDRAAGRNSGYGVDVSYPNDLWYAEGRVNMYGDAFDPKLGFLPRPGTRQYITLALYRPRPAKGAFDWVRQFQFGGEYIQVDDLDGRAQSKELAVIPLRFTTDTGYYFSVTPYSRFEALTQPFTVAPGVTIPVGQYRFSHPYNINFNTPESAPWTVYVNADAGDFYTGTIKSESVEVDWTAPGGKVKLNASNENDFGVLPQGTFVDRLDQLGATFSFTPNLLVSTFAQYSSAFHQTGINARFEWIIQPGKQLYVVYNHGIEPQIASMNAHQTPPTGDEITVKLVWDFYW